MGMTITPNPYSVGERIFRTAVFQASVYNSGWIERFLIWLFSFFAQISCCPKLFDTVRAEKGLNALKSLGAEVKNLTPRDGRARIQMMTLKSSDLEQKIKSYGAKWEKITLPGQSGKSVYAIIPPAQPGAEWASFEHSLLRFKWKKQPLEISPGICQEVIVTCPDASCIAPNDEHQNLFLHSNSASVSFIMLMSRMGFYLGCKQNICFYDPRGTWKSTGIASEAGYYNDITAVHNEIKHLFPPANVWVTSACGGVPAAAYLKSQVHSTGTNFIFENGFFDLKEDYIDPQFCMIRRLSYACWGGLASKDIDLQHKPQETGFNIHQLWRHLGQSDIGKVMIVRVNNDQRLSPDVTGRMVKLATRVNAKVFKLAFDSQSKDPHSDRYYTHNAQASKGLKFIFNRV